MSRMNCHKTALQQLPKGVVALFSIQIFSTLSFSVLYSTLVLYMTGPLAMPAKMANSIMGVFVAFNYALHLLGGYWGGRFLSNRSLFCIGMIAQIIGCALLATVNQAYLHYGLAAFLTGCGLNVTCVNCMLTQRFSPEDSRREGAFLYNYAGMNIGFFIGFTMSGYFQLDGGYQHLFLLSCIGNLIALIFCLANWHSLDDINTTYSRLTRDQKIRTSCIGIFLVLVLPYVMANLLHSAEFAGKLVLFTGFCMLVLIIWLAMQQGSAQAREKMYAFAVLMLVGTVFWTLFQIGPMGLTHFIDNNVQRNWLLITIPPQWFQNINTICIVLGGPVLSWALNRLRAKEIKVNIPVQFALALALIGLAFAILPLGIANANASGLVSPMWIVMCFVLQSIGELLISPIGYAMIGALAPSSLQGIMMGMWMLSTGVGATLSSYSSNWMTAGQDSFNPLLTNPGYSHVFLILGLTAMSAGLILFFVAPVLRRWMSNKTTEVVKKDNLVVA